MGVLTRPDASMVNVAIAALPPMHISGFEVTRDVTVPTKRLVVAPGLARSLNNDADIALLAGIMKRLDQTFSEGDGGGALDQGALAASTWYHLHSMRKPATGAVDILVSGSLTNPLMPAGWTAAPRRRIWSVRTDASANLLPFLQVDDWCGWGIMDTQYTGNLGASPTLVTMKCPTGFKCRVQGLLLSDGVGSGELGLMDPDGGDPSTGRFWTLGTKKANDGFEINFERFTDINGRLIGWANSNINCSVQTVGYWDRRGRL